MTHKPRQKVPGMSRELTSLYLENQAIPVVLEQFQAKPKFGTKAERWVWRGFRSSARGDDLALHHWAKANEQYTDYYYARFNAKTNPYQYTDEEYEKCIESLDKGWSRIETDYLLHMCRLFDLRFIIIHDRYYSHIDCPSSGIEPNRTLEDLKGRYYAIGRALTQYRAGEDSRDPEDVPLQTTNKLADDLALLRFDKDKELERKKYLEALFHRTKEEIEEEELLTAEARRIEANERRLVHEREVLLHVSDLVRKSASPSRSVAPSVRSEQGNLSPTFGDPTFGTEIHTVKPAVVEIEAADIGTIVVPQRDARLGPGVFLRSDKLHPIPKNKLDAVKQFMSQLALNSPNTIWPRPVMATPAVCDRFDSLQSIIIPLLDFKKTADKLETEVQVLRARKRMLVNDIGEGKAEELLNRLPSVDTTSGGSSTRHQRKSSNTSSRRKSRDSVS
ncbi:hypothetical protein COEREDRAFT_69646 [Coemansia reversa NRRL 1564]|uniref:SWR1-complex protein 4 n=1 Tax=Coemansia reversa (strain ATCC 12441 / NRRL 1564) TaxID=763665 RepID=A0A2G5BJ18_COERN|nr:hypothetical protein COEREDRAFT_69646 [Coemansia reversa NRRL 1564]|eukprot:PIA18989.1 hypothetical protein COEREDRAFT_69646 [Coemansia reversa NRRL 1564]